MDYCDEKSNKSMSIWINVIQNPTRVWLREFMWPLIQLELPYNDAFPKVIPWYK